MYQNKQLTLGFFEHNRDAQHANSVTSRLGPGKFPQLQIKLLKKKKKKKLMYINYQLITKRNWSSLLYLVAKYKQFEI